MKKVLSLLISALLLVAFLTSCEVVRPEFRPAYTAEDTETDVQTETRPDPETETQIAPPETGPAFDPASVTPLLWRATDGEGHEIYLFGTIHAADARTGIALDKLSGRIKECDALAVEFDVVAFGNDLSAAIKMYQPYVLTDGTRITDHLPADLYEKAADQLKRADMYSPMMDFYNLAMWWQLIDQALLINESDLDTEWAMDTQLINFAYDNGIEVLDVESAEFQNEMVLGLSDKLLLLLIKDTLEDPETAGESLNDLYAAWVAGDEDAILGTEEIEEGEYTEEELALIEDYNKAMLYDRNIGMADKAEEWLTEGKKVFFAVGCAHMLGEGGIVDLLTQRGYTVERVPVD